MNNIFKLIAEGGLSEFLTPTALDKNLLKVASEFEDFCNEKFDAKTSNEILGYLDRLTEFYSQSAGERFLDGVKIGIALSKESQQHLENCLKNQKM